MLTLPKPTTALTSKSINHASSSSRLTTRSSEQGVDVMPDNHSLTTSNSTDVISAFLKSQLSSCTSPTGKDNDTPTPSQQSASSANNILPSFLTFSPETKRHVRAHMRAKVSTKRISKLLSKTRIGSFSPSLATTFTTRRRGNTVHKSLAQVKLPPFAGLDRETANHNSGGGVQKKLYAPKHPMTAFVAFTRDERAAAKQAHPNHNSADIMKTLAVWWKKAPKEVRKRYFDDAFERRQAYFVAVEAWQKQEQQQQQDQDQFCTKVGNQKEAASSLAAMTAVHDSQQGNEDRAARFSPALANRCTLSAESIAVARDLSKRACLANEAFRSTFSRRSTFSNLHAEKSRSLADAAIIQQLLMRSQSRDDSQCRHAKEVNPLPRRDRFLKGKLLLERNTDQESLTSFPDGRPKVAFDSVANVRYDKESHPIIINEQVMQPQPSRRLVDKTLDKMDKNKFPASEVAVDSEFIFFPSPFANPPTHSGFS